MVMTSRERFFKALNSEAVDRPPVFSICQHATYEQMDQLQSSWPEAHEQADKMAALAAGGFSLLGFDAVRVPFCQTMEAEALGATLKKGGREGIPSVDSHPYGIDESPVFPEDFLQRGRIPQLLEAVRILKATIGRDAVIIGGIIGPFTLAVNLVGATPMLKACRKSPEKLLPFLEVAEKAGSTLAEALVDAGADVICVEDMMASMEMISPTLYRSLAAPFEKKQFGQIRVPTIIHICGRMNLVIEDLANTEPTAISVETSVNLPEAIASIAKTGRRIPLIGGVDPIGCLLNGSPAEIKAEVTQAVAAGISLISPGCSVAPGTPTANLQAMVNAVISTKEV